LDKALILCEGKTDGIYLKSAIRKLKEFQPKLAKAGLGPISLNVRFFRYSPIAHEILQLSGGTGDLKFFTLHYAEAMQKFKHAPLKHPVIILIDNDDGATPILQVMKSKFHITADLKTDLPFFHLCENLFLVKTPALGLAGTSYIENFFEPALLNTVVDGKKFNLQKAHEAPDEYGKLIFAEKVIKPNIATIDFSGFANILQRIVGAMDHYQAIKAVKQPV
jgi:hypothetical protein